MILAVIAVIIVVAVYFMGMWEPTKPISDAATSLGNQAMGYVQKNIPTVVAAGGTVTALGGVALSKINTAKQQTAQVTNQANSQINGLLAEKDKVEGTLTAKESELTQIKGELETTKTTLTDAQGKLAPLEAENLRLKTSLNQLNDQSALAIAYAGKKKEQVESESGMNSRLEEAITEKVA